MAENNRLRFAVDTGGTFTDLVIYGDVGGLKLYKRSTTPEDPVCGVLNVLEVAAEDFEAKLSELLCRGDLFVFGTTSATNAIVTGATAKTAFLTTQGHSDILVFREGGGRTSIFDYTQDYPDPYISRALTFEVPERIRSDGQIVKQLDEKAFLEITQKLAALEVEAVAVCLLWSIVNPSHELRIGELLDKHLPGVPYTLSHMLNPTLREYRRASSTAIDASLKPLMSRFFERLADRLREEGFGGRLLIMTSAGGVLDAEHLKEAPIHSIGSGPAAAPIAGRYFADIDTGSDNAIVTDAGGTTYDVSLIRQGQIPWTRETMVGHPTYGYITGFPSVDVKSIGSAGGSIAWVDKGGLLHVGPKSAGARPGPACYGRGGDRPTVTDACLVLGYIDPEYFLGGDMRLALALARKAIERDVSRPLGVDLFEAASAVLTLATEQMMYAIEGITLKQGIDPTAAILIGGGGGAGLYSVGIARRLGCSKVVIPAVSAALSATGAILSDLRADYAATDVVSTDNFDYEKVNRILSELYSKCQAFREGPGAHSVSSNILFSVEARYPHQVWEIEVPLTVDSFRGDEDVEQVRQDFHRIHDEVFAVTDPNSAVEIVSWRARVTCSLGDTEVVLGPPTSKSNKASSKRIAYFPAAGLIETPVYRLENIDTGSHLFGPVIVESPVTTVVIDPGASLERATSGSLLIFPGDKGERNENMAESEQA